MAGLMLAASVSKSSFLGMESVESCHVVSIQVVCTSACSPRIEIPWLMYALTVMPCPDQGWDIELIGSRLFHSLDNNA